MAYDDERIDPIIADLTEKLRETETYFAERKSMRSAQGDNTPNVSAFLTVTVDTEDRTYTGRMFDIWTAGPLLDLYDVAVNDPRIEMANPRYTIRGSAIVAARVHEEPGFQPVDFPMPRKDFHATVTSFITKAASILADPEHGEDDTTDPADVFDRLFHATEPVAITREQGDALRDAAQPINDLIFNTTIISRWEKAARAIAAREDLHSLPTAYDDDPHLNVALINTNDPYPGPTTLLRYLTHGVPLAYLYPETHQQALDAYRSQVIHDARTRGITPRTDRTDLTVDIRDLP